MVFADSVEELLKREKNAEGPLQELEEKRKRDPASIRKSDITKLFNQLHDINDLTFITLPVFSGGTLSNSFAESINNCLRRAGVTVFGSRLDSIYILRSYCNSCITSVKKYSKERQLLLENYMQPDVMKCVSNGILRQQAKLFEQLITPKIAVKKRGESVKEYACKIEKEEGSSFVVEKTIQKGLSKVLLIQRKTQRKVVVWIKFSFWG